MQWLEISLTANKSLVSAYAKSGYFTKSPLYCETRNFMGNVQGAVIDSVWLSLNIPTQALKVDWWGHLESLPTMQEPDQLAYDTIRYDQQIPIYLSNHAHGVIVLIGEIKKWTHDLMITALAC